MDNYIIEYVHISKIRKWDTILHTDGLIRTVGNNIKRSDFFGYTLFGDSYKLGRILVKKLNFYTYEEIKKINENKKCNIIINSVDNNLERNDLGNN